MAPWRPDPSFYPSPRLAAAAPREELAYVALLNASGNGGTDAMGVVDVNPDSPEYGKMVGKVDMPFPGDELHHFGWNACSSHLCPWAPHAHVERRYLVVPGIHSSRIHILDTKPDPRNPKLVKVIEPETLMERTGYSSPHTVHCGPDGIYLNGLGAPDGDGPGGIFVLDHETFEPRGAWELDRGPQFLSYDFAWHLGQDTVVTSEWGTPNMVKDGLNPELLLGGKYGNALHVWDLRRRKHLQTLELGPQYQMTLELRPARDPSKAYGFAGVVISTEDLSASVWLWYRDGSNGTSKWAVKKVIDIPAEPADPEVLPPMLKGFGAVPPLVTDLNLSLDDRFLYVSCWGTGEMIQYDVSDPFHPRKTGSVRIGGIVGRTPHPARPDQPLNGGPRWWR
jgi:methanethiol oxidase